MKHITGGGSSGVKAKCLNSRETMMDRGKNSQSSDIARYKSKGKRKGLQL